MNVFETDPLGRFKTNPLAYWTRQMSWAYVLSRSIPHNVLHDRGYPSIGDEPLTEPVDSGDVERAGRWKGSPKGESGMHY
jgi:phosphoadenosine phosphosulfate reductase